MSTTIEPNTTLATMHPLLQRLTSLQQQVQRGMFVDTLARGCCVVLIASLVLGAIDYCVRIPLVQTGCSLFWYVVVFLACGYVVRKMQAKIDLLDLTRGLERAFPKLRDQLSSATEFLIRSRRETGSNSLKQLMISRTWEAVQQHDLSAATQPKRMSAEVAAALFLCGTLAVLTLCTPRLVATAAVRLAIPQVGSTWNWPRRIHLSFVDAPRFVPQGEGVQFSVTARDGISPTSVELLLRHESGAEERHPMQFIDQQWVFRLPRVAESLDYRGVGGDDQHMPWQRLQLIEPLTVHELTIEVVAPSYSSLKPRPVTSPVKMVAGSQLRVRGRAEQGFTQVRLRHATTGRLIQGQILQEHAFLVESSSASESTLANGRWQLELMGANAVLHRVRELEIEIEPDQPPWIEVAIPRPDTLMTPAAVLRLAGHATDDLGLKRVWCTWRVAGNDPPQTIDLSKSIAAEFPSELSFAETLDETQIARSGESAELTFIAEDGVGQLSPVVIRHIRFVSPEAMRTELTQRQDLFIEIVQNTGRELAVIRTALAENITSQQQREGMIDDQLSRFDKQLAMLFQREAGLRSQLEEWLQTWRDNRLPEDRLLSQWQVVFQEMNSEFAPACQLIRPEIEHGKQDDAALTTAGRQLTERIAHIDRWLKGLAAEGALGKIAADLSAIKDAQTEIERQTNDSQIAWLTSPAATTAGERAKLASLQWDVAREWDRWLARLGSVDSSTAENATAWSSLATAARESSLGTDFRESARAIEAARGAQGATIQAKTLRKLNELVALLPTAEANANQPALGAWEQTWKEIGKIVEQQQTLDQAWQDNLASRPTERQRLAAQFAKDERGLAQAIEKLAAELNPSELAGTKRHLNSAAESLRGTAAAAEREAWRDSLAQSLNAIDFLQTAQKATNSAVNQAQQEVRRQRLQQLLENLRRLIPQQADISLRTRQLSNEIAKQSTRSRSQMVVGEQLQREQTQIAEDVARNAKQVDVPAVTTVLDEVRQLLTAATSGMSQGEISEVVQQKQSQAEAHLKALFQLLLQESRTPPEVPSDDPTTGEDAEKPTAAQASVLEMQIILQAQREIGRRVTALPSVPKDARLAEREALIHKQQNAARVVEMWLKNPSDILRMELPQSPAAWQQKVTQELAGGDDVGQQQTPPIARLGYRLRLAEGMLTQDHLSDFPQLQTAIEEQLNRLIEATTQQQRRKSQQKTASKSGQPANASGEPNATSGVENSQQNPKSTKVEFSPAELRELSRKVWGHLPPKVREELLQVSGDEFLPEYAAQIQEYFRRLAKQRAGAP